MAAHKSVYIIGEIAKLYRKLRVFDIKKTALNPVCSDEKKAVLFL
jgi:hypothetical protein